MKKFITLLIILLHQVAVAQVAFQKVFSGNNKQIWSGSICNVPGNRFALTGTLYDNSVMREKGFVQLINQMGDTLWFRSVQDTADVTFENITFTSDSNLVVVGKNSNGILFIKYNLNGDVLLSKFIGSPDSHLYDCKIINTSDTGYLVIATVNIWGPNNTALIKLNSIGNVEWAKQFVIPVGDITTADSGFMMACNTSSSILLLRIDLSGSIVWSQKYEFGDPCRSYEIKRTIDNGFIIGGYVDRYPSQDLLEGLLLKVDSAGVFQWSVGNSYYGNDIIPSTIYQRTNGNYVFAGDGLCAFGFNFCLAEVDPSGVLIWNKAYKTDYSSVSRIFEFVPTFDNGFLINTCGMPYGLGLPDLSCYIIKTDSLGNSGCNDTSGTITQNVLTPIPDTFLVSDSVISLASQNKSFMSDSALMITDVCFSVGIPGMHKDPLNEILLHPNPTQGKFTISNIQSPINQIEIFNLLGKKVFTVTGNGLTTVDCGLLTPGIYILQASDGKKSWRGKVVKE